MEAITNKILKTFLKRYFKEDFLTYFKKEIYKIVDNLAEEAKYYIDRILENDFWEVKDEY